MPAKGRRLALLLLLIAGPLIGCGRPDGLLVFGASSLREPLGEIAESFEARTGIPVQLSLGGSGALAQQLRRGAPADLLLAAAPDEIDRLIDEGILRGDSRTPIAENRLALVVGAGSGVDGLERLASGTGRVAVGNPRTAPAGRYAQRLLELRGLGRRLEPRLVRAENVRQALSYLVRGEVDAALVYVTEAGVAGDTVRVAQLFEEHDARPLYVAAASTASTRRGEAEQLLAFMLSDTGRTILTRHGFVTGPS